MKRLLLLDAGAAMETVVTATAACLWEQPYTHKFSLHKQSHGVPQGPVLGPFRSTLR